MWSRGSWSLLGQRWPRSPPVKVTGRGTPSPSTSLPAWRWTQAPRGQARLLPLLLKQWRCMHLDSLKDRGVYDERHYQKVRGSDVRSLELASDGKSVSITWSDGRTSRFHSLWLRYTCHCPNCRVDGTGQTAMELDTITDKSHISHAADDGHGCVEVQWTDCPGHTGLFPVKFLKANCYSKDTLEERRNNARMTFAVNPVIPRVSYQEVVSGPEGLYRWLRALNERGITIVDNVPCQVGMVKKVCTLIADYLQHTLYGETYQGITPPDAANTMFQAGGLRLHMDQIMYEAPPGIQALHCIKFDPERKGGETTFADLFHVAEMFRQQHPDMFHLLCEVPVCHQLINYNGEWPAHFRFHRPVFSLNRRGDLIGVTWNPDGLGPPQIEEELLEPFALAYGKLYTLINTTPHMFRHRLKPGEMVTFNNRRMVHGRAAFHSQHGQRHLEGCYVEISEFLSRLNVLSNQVGDGRPPVRAGNCDHE